VLIQVDNLDHNNDKTEPVGVIEETATSSAEQPDLVLAKVPYLRPLLKPAFWVILFSLLAGLYVHDTVEPEWREHRTSFQVFTNEQGQLSYISRGDEVPITGVVAYADSVLRQEALDQLRDAKPPQRQQWVVEYTEQDGQIAEVYSLVSAKFHFGVWSLLPALVAVALCLLTKEPLSALLGGIVVGGFMLGRFDITNDILLPNLATESAAGVLMLYLWLLGGLMGIWSRTGAAQAFAEWMTKHFVRGPRSAKLVAWSLGVIFFQGGSVSTVLVGTTVKPIADKNNISHEELAYIVDSTASPIASVLAFNAWPAYIQALIFVPGVAFLSTEAERISFFFASVPFSFYGILAVLGTLLLSLDILGLSGSGLRKARARARETGELDAPGASPLSAKELHASHVPAGYTPNVLEFIVPLVVLIGVAVGTFVFGGVPQVNWAFASALMISIFIALVKGMSLGNVIEGFGDGLKGVVLASVILMLAITVGAVSKETGAGMYMVELLGQSIPFWCLPVALQMLTMVTAFSTGTSWGTYAIAFPLALPLAWVVAQTPEISNPELYMSVCFAAVLNGSVYGDQCSPISDTTILSAMTTGCDLMDHVKTQIVPASFAAAIAAVLWTGTVLVFA
jgi:Na+/H+ antiporter NhaC